MVHNSLGGKMFRAWRLVCVVCCERVTAAERESAFVPRERHQDGVVEANF